LLIKKITRINRKQEVFVLFFDPIPFLRLKTPFIVRAFHWNALAACGIAVREATNSDDSFLRTLYRSIREPERAWVPWSDDEWGRFVDLQFQARSASYSHQFPELLRYILETDGNPRESIWIHETPQELRLVDLALLPEVRNQGIGTAALKDIQSDATKRSRPVVLHVYSDNPALRLYQRMGFSTVRQSDGRNEMRWQP